MQALVTRDVVQRLALTPGAGITASVAPASVLVEAYPSTTGALPPPISRGV